MDEEQHCTGHTGHGEQPEPHDHVPDLAHHVERQDALDVVLGQRAEDADDYAACEISSLEELRDLFVPHFYFGCEADDPVNASAFDAVRNPLGARLRAIFSSDIGHWDVPDMREVLEEAYELVERSLLTEADFRAFTFETPVKLWAGANPRFFEGTVVEDEVASQR